MYPENPNFTFTVPSEFYTDLDHRIRKAVAEALGGVINEPSKDEKFLTKKQVADQLHISLPTVDAYCERGILKRTKIGNRVLFSESVLKESLLDLPVRFSHR